MRVTFWGVRGTFPVSGAEHARYGGDTMCVSVEHGENTLFLDAGSGLRNAGAALTRQQGPLAAHVVISHLQMDHVLGLTQFAPLWRAGARISVYAPRECLNEVGADALLSVMRPPLLRVDASQLPAAIELRPYALGDGFEPVDRIRIETVALNRPGACAGIIVHAGARKVAYVTDHERGVAEADERLACAVEGADLLIYGATFTEAEMAAHRDGGRSTWEAGVRLKRRAGVKLLALAHHHPDRTDEALDVMAEAAAALSENVFFARQGHCLRL